MTTLFNLDAASVRSPVLFVRNLLQPGCQDICLLQDFLGCGGDAHEAECFMLYMIQPQLDRSGSRINHLAT